MTEVLKEGEIVNKPPEPTADDILEGAIKVYEEKDWYGSGWGSGNNVCILESVNVARGNPGAGVGGVPAEVVRRIHRAIWPEQDIKGRRKETLAYDIIGWNDGGTASRAGGKKHVVSILKKARDLGKKKGKK